MTDQEFLDHIDQFLKRTKMTPTAFGRLAVKRRGFVTELKRGLSPSLRTANKALQFIDCFERSSGEAAQ